MYGSDRSIASAAASIAAAIFLFGYASISSDHARAEPIRQSVNGAYGSLIPPGAGSRELPSLPRHTEPGDMTAALEAVEIALTQAGDGATYVWRRGNGRLTGAVRPTSTFRDADRRVCRHLEMQLWLGTYSRRTEGIACRGDDGVWLLEG